MTLANLSTPSFTGADLSARVNATLLEIRAARRFASVAALLADAGMAYGTGLRPVAAGDRIETADGFAYDVAPAGATDHHVATAGGVRLRVVPGPQGADMRAFGCRLDGSQDDTARFTAALAAFDVIVCPRGTYRVTSVAVPSNKRIVTAGKGTVFQQAAGVPTGTRLIRITGSGVQLGLEGFTVRGNIATDVDEQNHGVYCSTWQVNANLADIVIGDVWGENIRGDVIYLGQHSGFSLLDVKIGWIRGSNIFRNVVTVAAGNGVRVEAAEGTQVGYCSFLIEANLGNGLAQNIWCGFIKGRMAGVAGPSPADFADGIHFGTVDLSPAHSGQSNPVYAPGENLKDGLLLRNLRRLRIDHFRAEGFDRCAAFVTFNAGELGAELVEVGTMRLRNCSLNDTLYNAFLSVGGSRWDVGMLDVEATVAGKRVFDGLRQSRIGVVRATLANGATLLRDCQDCIVGPLVQTGTGTLLASCTRVAVKSASFTGTRLAANCTDCSFENVLATASEFLFSSGQERHAILNCSLNGDTYGLGMGARHHGAALRFGSWHLWVDATGRLRASGSVPGSDTAGTAVAEVLSETAANLALLTATVNTTGKIASRRIWDSTNRREMRARGPLAADPWDVVDGSAFVTPAAAPPV